MQVDTCAICVSPLRAEIEKRDVINRSTKTIAWARSQGVYINKFVLAKHRANHMNDNGDAQVRQEPGPDVMLDSPQAIIASEATKQSLLDGVIARIEATKQSLLKSGHCERSEAISNPKAGDCFVRPETGPPRNNTDMGEVTSPVTSTLKGGPDIPAPVTDQHFLNTVRDMVFQMLVDGKIELKVDSAFKAIEIKHKITEESQNERTLLEILSEIRKEELWRIQKFQDVGGLPS